MDIGKIGEPEEKDLVDRITGENNICLFSLGRLLNRLGNSRVRRNYCRGC